MFGFVVQRLFQAVLVVIAMSILVFIGVNLIGNPVDILISPDATEAVRQDVIHRFGLDLPLWQQYFFFVGRILHGDFGNSFVYAVPVMDLIADRAPTTIELVVGAILVATVVGVPLGMYAGYRPHSVAARVITGFSILGFSVPTFWIGILLILTFAVKLGWFPPTGRGATVNVFGVPWSFLTLDGLRHLILPVINLALLKISLMIRLSYAGTREAMVTDYVRFARAAGLRERTILARHVLKSISIPLVTVLGIELGSTLAFAIVTETIFNRPGLGKLIIDSILILDRPVMVAYLVCVSVLFVIINLVVEFIHLALDPRLRQGSRV
jgi:peptide/nickel transport system permease protein